MPELTDLVAKQQVEAWMSKHRPGIQGEKDSKAGIPHADSSEITPYEWQLVESYEKEIQLVKKDFTNRDSDLYTTFNEVRSKLKIEKKEYDRLRAKVGDRDPEVYIPPFVLLIICIISLMGLSIINIYFMIPAFQNKIFIDSYFLSLMFDNDMVPMLLGVILAASNLAIAYFSGRLVRQHGLITLLISYMSILFLCFMIIFIIILSFSHFETKSNIIAMSNLVVFLLVTASSFFAYDTEPHYPKIKKKADRLLNKMILIVSERNKNLEIHDKIQNIYVSGAQELDKQYRRSIEKVRPEEKIKVIKENILPEFKTVELQLQDSDDISRLGS